MIRRALSPALVLMFTITTSAAAQQASNKTCNGRQPVGFLGIVGLECSSCSVGHSDPDLWSFRTEPRIVGVDAATRGGALLKSGDVITHIDGKLITTREGARAMGSVKPGQAVILTIRRNGEQLKFAITAESACSSPSRYGIYAPTRVQGSGSYAEVAPRASVSPLHGKIATPTPMAATSIGPRASFGFGLGCSDCSITAEQVKGVHVMMFDKAPEVAYIDVSGPAYKAGLRRGDVLTHIDGVSFTSSEGARKFATAEPGEPVRFTVVRNGRARTYTVRATTRTPLRAPTDLAKSSESLERAQKALQELQREQAQQMAQIQEELRRSRDVEENRVREMQREFYKQEQEHRRKLNELSSELARAESRMRAALADSTRNACSVSTVAPGGRGGTARTLRYTGVMGDSEVEVRGPNAVSVSETPDEITISVGTTQVKVKNPRKR